MCCICRSQRCALRGERFVCVSIEEEEGKVCVCVCKRKGT